MTDSLAAVEAALSAVKRARQGVQRAKSKQVTSAEEIDRLKSVAHAWFQTHRPLIATDANYPDLSAADQAFRSIMGATAKHAARATYANSLKAAAKALVPIRTAVVTIPPATGPTGTARNDAHPNFGALTHDMRMQAILVRRWREIQTCVANGACMSATVMMGGILESLLLARINASPNRAAIFTAKTAPRDKSKKTLAIQEWKLRDMIEVGHELGWITKSAKDVGNVLRDFRNYIHPHKEHADNITITQDDVGMFWELTKTLSRQVLASVGKTP